MKKLTLIVAAAAAMALTACNENKETKDAAKQAEPQAEAQAANTEAAKSDAESGATAQQQEATSPQEAGAKFLEENAKNEGVVTTASGLQYQVIKEGTGRQPKATDLVSCHYEGRLIDGKVFDSSYLHGGEPLTFPLNGVIKGWTEGVQLMKEGAKYRFFIPYNLAYGENGIPGTIPPYATLVFDVELVKIEK